MKYARRSVLFGASTTLVGALVSTGCSNSLSIPSQQEHPMADEVQIEGPERQFADSDFRWEAKGFTPNETVDVSVSLRDDAGTVWSSEATYRCDDSGRVGDHSVPVSGSYTSSDSNGLIWSLSAGSAAQMEDLQRGKDVSAEAAHSYGGGRPFFLDDKPALLEMEVTSASGARAQTSFSMMRFYEASVETKVSENGVVGVLFEPPESKGAVILLSGSSGGVNREHASLLSRHGYTVLSLAYFGYPGRPQFQANMPLEYFRDAIDWLRARSGFQKVGIQGISRGAEAALVIASVYPARIGAVVAVAPSHLRFGAFDGQSQFAPGWTLNGEVLPYAGTLEDAQRLLGNLPPQDPSGPLIMKEQFLPVFRDSEVRGRASIEVELIDCPILLVSGRDDNMWPAVVASEYIEQRLVEADFSHPFETLVLDDAGHGITSPGGSTMMLSQAFHPVMKAFMSLGGSPSGNANAQRVMWEKALELYDIALA